jgi:hypothetical protein
LLPVVVAGAVDTEQGHPWRDRIADRRGHLQDDVGITGDPDESTVVDALDDSRLVTGLDDARRRAECVLVVGLADRRVRCRIE